MNDSCKYIIERSFNDLLEYFSATFWIQIFTELVTTPGAYSTDRSSYVERSADKAKRNDFNF